jgi:hypothetical protein
MNVGMRKCEIAVNLQREVWSHLTILFSHYQQGTSFKYFTDLASIGAVCALSGLNAVTLVHLHVFQVDQQATSKQVRTIYLECP